VTDLERFRVYARTMATAHYARTMATAQHTPTCRGLAPSRWGWAREVHPDPKCPGCVSDDDRALWARLADEATAYLDQGPTLWEDA
jgi:hypothetical protein